MAAIRKQHINHVFALISFLLLTLPAHAGRWVSHPDKSRLSFTALQQGNEFQGVFDDFSAGFVFDPANPDGGSVAATIRLASVDTEYDARDEYLLLDEWFHTDAWPDATYVADKFTRVADDEYAAQGILTLRGISKPVELRFTLLVDDLGENAVLVGSAEFLRLDFGVGQGDWVDTSWIGNQVTINMELQLLRSFE